MKYIIDYKLIYNNNIHTSQNLIFLVYSGNIINNILQNSQILLNNKNNNFNQNLIVNKFILTNYINIS
jgi:hypothetical protein